MNKINYPSKTSEFKALKKEYQSCILNSSKIDLTEIQNFLTSIGVKESFENILVLPLDELIQITPLSATNVFLGLTDTQIKDRKRNIASYFKYVQFQQRELSIFFNSYSVIGYKFKNYKELTPIKSTFPPEKLHNIFCNTSTYKLHFTYKLLKTIFKILIQY